MVTGQKVKKVIKGVQCVHLSNSSVVYHIVLQFITEISLPGIPGRM